MRTRSMAVMIVVGACMLGLAPMASAQNAVGGPKKPVTVGGAAKQNSLVMPANKGGATPVLHLRNARPVTAAPNK
jgi:hypothetical protein